MFCFNVLIGVMFSITNIYNRSESDDFNNVPEDGSYLGYEMNKVITCCCFRRLFEVPIPCLHD